VAAVLVRAPALSDSLVDLLDSLVDTGVAAGGDVTISVAGVDLIALRLKALLASVGTEGADELAFPGRERRERRTRALPARVDADENSLQRGLAQLVLLLVEILGELLERQAVRRMSAGSLSDEEAERLGAAFLALHRRVDELYDELVGGEDPWPQPFGPRTVRRMVPPTVS
jgi:NTP pyrophosphatase (non-canonical NTP hydrolase)